MTSCEDNASALNAERHTDERMELAVQDDHEFHDDGEALLAFLELWHPGGLALVMDEAPRRRDSTLQEQVSYNAPLTIITILKTVLDGSMTAVATCGHAHTTKFRRFPWAPA